MSVGNLENIVPYLSDVPLSDILEQRYRADPELRSTFETVEIPCLNSLGIRRSVLLTQAGNDFKQSMFRVLGISPPDPAQSGESEA